MNVIAMHTETDRNPMDVATRLAFADVLDEMGRDDPLRTNTMEQRQQLLDWATQERRIATLLNCGNYCWKLPPHPELDRLKKAVGYRRRQPVRMCIATQVKQYGGYCDEGNITRWFNWVAGSGTVTPIPGYSPPQFGGPTSVPVLAVRNYGHCIVELDFSGSKPGFLILHVRPNNCLRWGQPTKV